MVFLFESGARISEISKFDDIQDTDQGMIIAVKSSKTDQKYRRNIYPTSSQTPRNLISYNALGKGSKLFPIYRNYTGVMLKRIGKKAGIEKPVTPHRFRHVQATDMAIRGYQESIIRKKLGWTDNSGIIARYTHLVDEDVINSTLEKNGQEIKKNPIAKIETAEPLNIIDAGAQLKQLQEKNEYLEAMMNNKINKSKLY